MAWRIALAALLLGWSAASYARHSFAVLDPRRASPGLSLQLAEVPSGGNGNGVRYALRAAGFPQSVTFGVWTRDFGRDFQELMSGIQFDAKGVPSGTDLAKGADRIEVDSGPYPKGAAWMVAIASEDHKLAAFARVIPHPIEVRDGRCAVSLELVSLYGTRFVASGTGFAPGEDVREVEDKLMKVVPGEFLKDAHHWLILHGRYVCKARKPDCPACVIRDVCGYKGKTKAASRT